MYFFNTNAHNYSFAVVGLSKRHNKVFPTRDAANTYMYKLLYLYGVLLNISENEDELFIHTRTPAYCSNYDLQYQNNVIKQIRDYFGGYFITDFGKNRYFLHFIYLFY